MKIELTESEIHYLIQMLTPDGQSMTKYAADKLRAMINKLEAKLKEAAELPKKWFAIKWVILMCP